MSDSLDCNQFEEFAQKHDADFVNSLLDEIAEAYLAKSDTERVCIYEVHRHDAINCTITGSVQIDDDNYDFIIDSGDWNGTVVRGWGNPPPYEPPRPTQYTLVPTNPNLEQDSPGMWKVYLEWKKQPWFTELTRSYMYDRHFAPGCKTESHYREKAAQKGLRFEPVDEGDTE